MSLQQNADVFSNVRRARPRLFLAENTIEDIRARLADGSDKLFVRYWDDVVARAEEYATLPVVEYGRKLGRMAHVGQECLERVKTMRLVHFVQGREDLGRKALDNALSISRFPDWSPGHGLDYAEMTHAAAVALDWLGDLASEQERGEMVDAIVTHGLEVTREGFRSEKGPQWMNWILREFNWNQVCNGGLLIGALGVAHERPEIAQEIIARTVESLPVALKTYAPEGVWGEGVNYWYYGTRYTAYAVAALESAAGTDAGLGAFAGMENTAAFPILSTGPSGYVSCFADTHELQPRFAMPVMFFLAGRFDDDRAAEWEHETLENDRAQVDHILWYVPRPAGKPRPSRDLCMTGATDVVSFRGSWEDPRSLFVFTKSGYNRCNHAHMDVGMIELDALGVRWCEDLGKDTYGLKGYWDRHSDEGKRWQYFRLGALSHNVPLLNGKNQLLDAETRVTKFHADDEDAAAVIDLSSAYPSPAQAMRRGVRMLPGRRAVLVQDEWDLTADAQLTWNMLTRAEVEVADGKATLCRDGEKLELIVLSPQEAQIEASPAPTEEGADSNAGVTRVRVIVSGCPGLNRIAVLLSPHWEDGFQQSADVEPLSDWPGKPPR
ncbi:MAG: hypothetical protein ACLFV7_04410 [Phycisphaerae bacterium]